MGKTSGQRAMSPEISKSRPDQTATQPATQSDHKYHSPITILRNYLTQFSPDRIDCLAQMDLIAMRAKIVLEHMQENGIKDINEGIRSFTAFERKRLTRLGFLIPRDLKRMK